MFNLSIENSNGKLLELTQNEGRFQVIGIDGLNPPKAQINRSTVAGMDGSKFNSSKLEERNIVITLRLNGEVETNRILLYSYFRTKERCKIYYSNDTRDVYAEGYIENVDTNLFEISEIMQVSIICPDPYFKSAQEIVDDVSKVLAAFEFPFSITSTGVSFSELEMNKITNVLNQSESECGLEIDIYFSNSVSSLKIVNASTGEEFTVNYSFLQNDRVTIVTTKGQKSIKLQRGATTINLFGSIVRGSVFFQLGVGDNYFTYSADSGTKDQAVNVVFRHYTVYRGV
ncbi:MAG: phage tail family protein [Bacteroidales bacterium]|nr:phage tail family protein [Bacteroidales bacterium]